MTEVRAELGSQNAVRIAVLRDYPLRLWAEQIDYYQDVLREFAILLVGEEQGGATAPRRLVKLAALISTHYAPLLAPLDEQRQEAWERGEDRIDASMPLPPGVLAVLDDIRVVFAEVDGFCRGQRMLCLPRSAELVAFSAWATAECQAQYLGAPPTPWPGPW